MNFELAGMNKNSSILWIVQFLSNFVHISLAQVVPQRKQRERSKFSQLLVWIL